MTREDALNELVAVEIELIRLTNKRNDLRKFVLMQEYSPQRIPQERKVAGHTKAVRSGAVSEATLTVLREHGGWMTVKEVAILMGSGRNAVNLTLDRLHKKGFVNKEFTHNEGFGLGQHNKITKWSLAVHADKVNKEVV